MASYGTICRARSPRRREAASLPVLGQALRQELERYEALELGVPRAVDDAHQWESERYPVLSAE